MNADLSLPSISSRVGIGTQGLATAGLDWDQMQDAYKTACLQGWMRRSRRTVQTAPHVVKVVPGMYREEQEAARSRREEGAWKRRMQLEAQCREDKRAQQEWSERHRSGEQERVAEIRLTASSRKAHREKMLDEHRAGKVEALRALKERKVTQRRDLLGARQQAGVQAVSQRLPSPQHATQKLIAALTREKQEKGARERHARVERENHRMRIARKLQEERSDEIRLAKAQQQENNQRSKDRRELDVIATRKQLRSELLESSRGILADRLLAEDERHRQTRCIREERCRQQERKRNWWGTTHHMSMPSPMGDVVAPSKVP